MLYFPVDLSNDASAALRKRGRQEAVTNIDHLVRSIISFFRSVYRELLFLSLTACGAENIDIGK